MAISDNAAIGKPKLGEGGILGRENFPIGGITRFFTSPWNVIIMVNGPPAGAHSLPFSQLDEEVKIHSA